MNSAPYGFDVDHVANIRSELSITVLEKKFYKIKKVTLVNTGLIIKFSFIVIPSQ